MRGLAYGILDPEGERYSLALMHRDECPACRAYVLSLRGLAAVLPVPLLLPGVLGASALAGTGAGVGASAAAQAGSGAGAQAGSGIGGALTASGGAGAGAAGGGWLLAGGPVGAKLAVGCLLALGVGASCVALTAGPIAPRHAVHRRHAVHMDGASAHAVQDLLSPPLAGVQSVVGASALRSAAVPRGAGAGLIPAARASREFGPEQALAPSTSSPAGSSSTLKAPSARTASSGGGALTGTGDFTSTAKPASAGQPAPSSSGGATGSGAGAAQHEFGIG
jgi:hypothetical protein